MRGEIKMAHEITNPNKRNKVLADTIRNEVAAQNGNSTLGPKGLDTEVNGEKKHYETTIEGGCYYAYID